MDDQNYSGTPDQQPAPAVAPQQPMAQQPAPPVSAPYQGTPVPPPAPAGYAPGYYAQPPAQPPPYGYGAPPPQPYGYPPMYPLPPKPPKYGLGKAITGMCLGIGGAFMGLIAIMVSWIPFTGLVTGLIYGIFALGLGIPGIILSISARKEGTDKAVLGMALAGLITSIVALSLGGLSLFVAVACTCSYSSYYYW